MAIYKDLEHIGDSQSPEWWGALQGLSLNGVNQELQFTADAGFQANINQNELFTFEVTSKGAFSWTNRLNLMSVIYSFWDVNNSLPNCLLMQYSILPSIDRRTGSIIGLNGLLPVRNKFSHTVAYYNGGRDSDTSFQQYVNGNYLFSARATGNPELLIGDNIYIDSSLFRLGIDCQTMNYRACVFRDLRIYKTVINPADDREKYHSLPNNTITAYCEWKCASAADFYVFGGNLYARNTGSSKDGLDEGTGYDMQVIGMGTTPVFATLF